MRRTEFRVLSAFSGEAALQLHKDEPVDLIITELSLDDMGGDALCALVRNDPTYKDVPLIMIYNDSHDELARVEQSLANIWIVRPVQPLQLLKSVGQFLTVQLIRSKRVPLRVTVYSKKRDLVFYCMSHDVSVTGMLLETVEQLDKGERIECHFTLREQNEVETEGEVVRSVRTIDGAHQYGIQFVSLSREFRKAIDTYVANVARGNEN